ncbi:MAG: alpha/beta fold hydrolase [Acidobacteria bacterium]|nr:alpha/beta fold hydrolase [Acidobacteriota bacterium]
MTRRQLLLTLAASQALRAEALPAYPDHDDLLYVIDPATGERRKVAGESDWLLRRKHIVAHMETVMGPFPTGPRPPLKVRLLEEQRGEGYRRRTITYEAKAGNPVPAQLYLPDAPGRRPAVLALHPTGVPGKLIVAGEGPRPNRAYAKELAQRGYVALAPDYPTMGDPQADAYELGYDSVTMQAIYNHSRGVDLLQSLDQVDGERIGAIGHSLGGHNSLFIAVFEPRVRAVVTSCGFNSFFQYYGGDLKGWGQDKYMPRIRTQLGLDPKRMPFDFTELLATIAPRAVFVNAPLHDANFEVQGVYRCLKAAAPVYEKIYHAQGRLVAVHPNCEHDFPDEQREQAYAFLDGWLG